MKKLLLIFLILFIGLVSFAISSPEWEDQTIYFIMIDRFANGDETNDDFGFGEAGNDNSRYNGGDLQGIIDNLDYIKDLGFTAIWITPPVANQWWSEWVNYGGYHGYWARDLKKIDEHFGDNDLYKELVEKAHEKGIYVIQDIVPNHMGDYFRFVDGEFEIHEESIPTKAPEQYPFSLNDYNEDKDENIYHWTPNITDFKDENQKYNYQMSGLDDLNTENPVVIDALKDSYTFWIDEVGIDGFRIDTVIYVPYEFWSEFLTGENGVYEKASENGMDDFIAFGEAWVSSDPKEDDSEKVVSEFFQNGMNTMLDFPLNIELRRVFKEGKPTDNLTYRLNARSEYFSDERLVTFVDNHDMDRFLKGAGLASLKQALGFIFTIPGIPCVYYGTEQAFKETRAAMFKEGYASENEDHYGSDNEMYELVKGLIEFRNENEVFRNGVITPLKDDPNGPGIFVFKIENEEQTAFVMLNTSDKRKIITNLESGLEVGTVIDPGFTISALNKSYSVDEHGELTVTMNPRSFYVGFVTDEKKEPKVYDLSISPEFADGQSISENYLLKGSSKNVTSLKLIIDSKIDESFTIDVVDDSWEYLWDISKMDPGTHVIVFKMYGEKRSQSEYSDEYKFILDIPEEQLVYVEDPYDDDKGPKGNYLYPKDITFKEQMDLLSIDIKKIGASLAITAGIQDLTTSWSPQLGFDHVTFQIYIDDPSKEGATVLPFQNAQTPEGFNWDYFIFGNGWAVEAYNSEGSGPENFGTPITPTPMVKTNNMEKTVRFIVSGDLIGNPESLEGFKFYITTWDFDGTEGKYRRIYPEPKAYHMGGGSETDPYIMDDILIEIE